MLSKRKSFLIAFLLSVYVTAYAEQNKTITPLPSPLTLEFALALDVSEHPRLMQAQALSDLSKAQILAAESQTGITSSIQGSLRYIEPPATLLDQTREDHAVHFSINKRLYDFGLSGNAEEAAAFDEQSSRWNYVEALNRHRIDVMQRFFNVLLADLQFIRDNEAMSVAFIRMDRLRMRQELGQVSDIDVLQTEAHYQNVRQQFFSSRSLQRSSRNQLANILNRPGDLASEVSEPTLKGLFEKLPEFETLQKQVLEKNPFLKSLRQKLSAAEKKLASARAFGRPTLDTEARWSEYERQIGNRNQWEVELKLNVPLWTGGASAAVVSRQQAELLKQRALLRQAEMDVGQALLDIWLQWDQLKVQRDEMESLIEFRDLYLDRSRALYELEWKTDLGDSMVRVSDARYRLARVRFDAAIAKARLDALLGKEVYPLEEKKSELKSK